jgi:hypothetical protein
VKYSYDFGLLARETTVLQGMIDRLTEIGRCCGIEMNAEKTEVVRISGKPSTVQIMIDRKEVENSPRFYIFYKLGWNSHTQCVHCLLYHMHTVSILALLCIQVCVSALSGLCGLSTALQQP